VALKGKLSLRQWVNTALLFPEWFGKRRAIFFGRGKNVKISLVLRKGERYTNGAFDEKQRMSERDF